MNFLKTNSIALLLVITTILSEFLHLAFVGMPFNEVVGLDSVVYYLVAQIGQLNFIPAIIVFCLIDKKKKASRAILFGLILWNCKELYDEFSYMLGLNRNVLIINGGLWGQVVLLLTVVFGSLFLSIKLKL